MEHFFRDLRDAVRNLVKHPIFTIVTLVTLLLGIGANTAIFSVIDTVLLEPLPYPQADRIVQVWGEYRGRDLPPLNASEGEFLDYRDRTESFSAVGGFVQSAANITGDGEPERIQVAYTSAGFFPALGVEPQVGSVYGEAEDQPGNTSVVVLSNGLWQRRYGSDPGVVGETLMMNDRAMTILGVMPSGFDFPAGLDLWSPRGLDPGRLVPRSEHYFAVIARLAAGTSFEQAQSEMQQIAQQFETAHPDVYPEQADWNIYLTRLEDDLLGEARTPLLILFGASLLVLLIACVNVANLLVGRLRARERETAVRVALGAGRGAIVRRTLTETILLSLIGGLLGLAAAYAIISVLFAVYPESVPRSGELSLDGEILLFALGLSLGTGLLLGLFTAVQASRPNLQSALKEGGGGRAAGSGQSGFRRFLVAVQVALALVLLVGAGLLMKSFVQLQQVEPGFDPDGLLTMALTLPQASYENPPAVARGFDELLDRLESVPGVEAAGAVSRLPLSDAGGRSETVGKEGALWSPGESLPEPELRWVDPRYFESMDIRLLEGRLFEPTDHIETRLVALIDESAAQTLWPDESPVGRRFKRGAPTDENEEPWVTVVGVVESVKDFALEEEPRGTVYRPQLQAPSRTQYIVVRTASDDPLDMAPTVRSTIRELMPDVPVSDVQPMTERLRGATAADRFAMLLLGLFALVAVILAAVGIYGVVSHSVGRRTSEIGVRLALGAERREILNLVMMQGMSMVLVGAAVGLLVAFWASRTLQSLLYGVGTTDPMVFVGVTLLLLAVAALATFLPARRASFLEPTQALRYE